MSFTFDSLKTAIQDYQETSETTFVNNLPVFIKEAEERILKNIELPVFVKTSRVRLRKTTRIWQPPRIFYLLTVWQ